MERDNLANNEITHIQTKNEGKEMIPQRMNVKRFLLLPPICLLYIAYNKQNTPRGISVLYSVHCTVYSI